MEIAQRVELVRERIRAAAARAGRHADDIQLVAISKYQPVGAVAEARRAGLVDFGENYVQELEQKRGELDRLLSSKNDARTAHSLEPRSDVRWHLVGHLQSNKARVAAAVADVVQSIDSEKLALELSKRCEQAGRVVDVFLQINIGHEPQKSGVLPQAAAELAARCRELPGVRVMGLMCIPPADSDPRAFFRAMRGLAKDARVEHLSMGMSEDFEIAVEEGATLVRVGTAIFGARPKLETSAS